MIPLIYHPIYSDFPLPEHHRYPKNKYKLLYNEVIRQQSLKPNWSSSFQFYDSIPISKDALCETHQEDYVMALFDGEMEAAKMRRIGFPWSKELIERTVMSVGGTALTAQLAYAHGVAIHVSGGYHHAHYDFGSGFCLFNDLVVAAHQALKIEGIEKVLIVDTDVHQGDGTATLCDERSDIITLSFHCEKNFPARKAQSDIDIGLARNIDDSEFISTFHSVTELAIRTHQPDLIIYDAGIDIHKDDELGYFDVSTQGIYKRDTLMLQMAKEYGLPIACVIGGGYRNHHEDLVPIHKQLFESAITVFGD
ncbi:histone deacetylase [Vibrio sp.]|nr:histone deacetylase [Vibrio sp.]